MAQAISDGVNHISSISRIHAPWKKITCNGAVKEFCSDSTLHGIRYFTEPKRHFIERIWWICSFSFSVIMCVISIQNIWTTWRSNPVTVTFDDKTTPIFDIPFPSITICTTQKIEENLSKIEENDGYEKLFPNELVNLRLKVNFNFDQCPVSQFHIKSFDRLEALAQLCPLISNASENWENIMENVSIYNTIKEISPRQSSIILSTKWVDSGKIPNFEPIFTREGLCFTANSINSRDLYTDEIASELLTVRGNPNITNWNVEDGYQSNVNESETYPYRVFDSSMHNAMTLVLSITVDNSFRLCTFGVGFIISLQMPDEKVDIYKNSIYMPSGKHGSISIKPIVMATSDGLRSYPPKVRGCYFRSERQLRFFKSYSQQKCEIECLANFTGKQCGCVRFDMPRENRTKVCRFSGHNCYVLAQIEFTKNLMVQHCQCLPDCTVTNYEVESSSVPIYQSAKEKQTSNEHGFKTKSVINISFKEQYFISIIRSETSTMSAFISNCGGLLGLFMGASMLSIVEMVYYFTLRMYFKLRRQRTVGEMVG